MLKQTAQELLNYNQQLKPWIQIDTCIIGEEADIQKRLSKNSDKAPNEKEN